MPPAAAPAEARLDAKILAAYAGDYRLSANAIVSFFVEGGRLTSQVTGQPKFPLAATSQREFLLTAAAARVVFDPPDASGRSPRVSLLQAGQEIHADLVVWPTPTEQRIGALVGHYFSPELNVSYEITYRDGRFRLRDPRGESELTPVNDHLFGAAPAGVPAFIDFTFDDAGASTGFALSDNARTRRLAFDHVRLEPVGKRAP